MRILRWLVAAALVLSAFLYGYSVIEQRYNVSMTRNDNLLCGEHPVQECEPITPNGSLTIRVSPEYDVFWGGADLVVDLFLNGRNIERHHAVSPSGVFKFELEARKLKFGLNKLEFVVRRPWAVRASESITFQMVVSPNANPGCTTPKQEKWKCPPE